MYTGFYNDGKTAVRHNVSVRLAGGSLHFKSADGRVVETWSGEKLGLREEAYEGKPVRLIHGDYPDAMITVSDPRFREQLLSGLPHLARRVVRGSTAQRFVKWAGIGVITISALVLGGPKIAAEMAHHIPDKWVDALGDAVVTGLVGGDYVCTEPDAQAALEQLARELVDQTEYDGALEISVVDDTTVNAFAAPGGRVVIFSGLIDAAANGDEVAGVLAHELAHVTERHAIEGLAQQLALTFVLSVVVGDLSGLAGTAADLGNSALSSRYSRSMEASADSIAVSMLNRAGYDAEGLGEFFRVLDENDVNTSDDLSWLSSHPLNTDRIAAVSESNRGGRSALPGPAWDAISRMCGPREYDESDSEVD